MSSVHHEPLEQIINGSIFIYYTDSKGKTKFRPAAMRSKDPDYTSCVHIPFDLSTKFIYNGKGIVAVAQESSHLDSKIKLSD